MPLASPTDIARGAPEAAWALLRELTGDPTLGLD